MVPPANQHRCVGFAPCPLIAFSSAKAPFVPGPKSHGHFPQQTWLHACKRVLVHADAAAWVSLFACLVAALQGLSPWLCDRMPLQTIPSPLRP